MARFSPKKAHDSLSYYHLSVHEGFKYAPFQHEFVIPKLEQFANKEIAHLLLLLPPSHGKSELHSSFVAHTLGRFPDRTLLSLCYGKDLVKDIARKVKRQVMLELHRECFPDFELSPFGRELTALNTTKDGGYFATSWESTVIGRHADYILVDDPMKNRAEAASPTFVAKRYNDYQEVLKTRSKPGGGVVLFTHRWGARDFVYHLLEDEGIVEQGGKWDAVVLPAQEGDDGAFLWEDFYGREWYEDKKFDKVKNIRDSWWSIFQQDPGQTSSAWFKEDLLQYYDTPIPPGKFNTYIICDPALKKNKESDRTSIMVLAAGPEERIFLVDWILDKMDPGQRAEYFALLIRRWKPEQILYEEFGLSADIFYLRKEMSERGIQAHIIAVGGHGPRSKLSKEARIKELQTDFREGRIFFPRHLIKQNLEGKTVDLMEYFINEEYLRYKGKKSVPHEDGLDTLSRIHEPEIRLVYANPIPNNDDDDDDRNTRHYPGGWQTYW